MISTKVLSLVTFIYFAAFIFYLFRMILGRNFWGEACHLHGFYRFDCADNRPDFTLEDVI